MYYANLGPTVKKITRETFFCVNRSGFLRAPSNPKIWVYIYQRVLSLLSSRRNLLLKILDMGCIGLDSANYL